VKRVLPAIALTALLLGCNVRPKPAAPAEPARPRFEDVTQQAGIRFRHFTGADGRFRTPESLGAGCAFLDCDGDGRLDVLLINGRGWPDRPNAHTTCVLYHNEGDGRFTDVTASSGLAVPLYGQGCAVGDYDADGRDDVLITCLGQNRLFRNLGDCRFRDVTAGSGLDDCPQWAWHTSGAWLDYNRDGRLDLFVCRYVKWSPGTDIPYRNGLGKRTYGGPIQYPPDGSVLYEGLGGGRFRNVSVATGVSARPGKGLGVVPLDENGDGWPDLLVANDLVPNHLWRNEHGERFREVGQETGFAVGGLGRARAGMGIDAADVRNNGEPAVAVGNFANEGLALFQIENGLYSDSASQAGLMMPSMKSLTFGLTFLDADGDGRQDLFITNGHIDPFALDLMGKPDYRQTPQLFQNRGDVFEDVTATGGPPLAAPQVGRGCAWGDWDNDGRPDLLLTENGGPARLLHNVTTAGHWLGVELRPRAGAPNPFGAEVRLTAGGVTQRRWIHSGGSYLSQSDQRALFGLGPNAALERLEVRWPSGGISQLGSRELDRYVRVQEP
jgi:hypothetical protein